MQLQPIGDNYRNQWAALLFNLSLLFGLSLRRVIGIDVNQTYIEHAPLMAKNVEFYCADISEIGNFSNFCTATDLAESSVNIVISTYWLSCLTPAAKAAAIGNMKRLLQPDGYLYILDLVWTDAYAIIHKLNHSDPWQAIIKEQKHSIGQNSAHQVLPHQ